MDLWHIVRNAALPVLFALCVTGSAEAGISSEGGASPATGTWQKHQYSFVSMGFTSTYSCDGLGDKLKLLLLASGARADVKAQGVPCAYGYGRPDKLARADLTFYTLVPNGEGKPEGQPEKGEWRSVKLSVHSPRELDLGDCELVDQFNSQILPMFATRQVDNRTTCVPNQNSGSSINLTFEAFAAMSRPRASS